MQSPVPKKYRGFVIYPLLEVGAIAHSRLSGSVIIVPFYAFFALPARFVVYKSKSWFTKYLNLFSFPTKLRS